MKKFLSLLFSVLVAVTMTTGDVSAQAGGITKSGTGLKMGWSWQDSLSTNSTALFPSFSAVEATGASGAHTVYVNDFYTAISTDTITGTYTLSLVAAPHLTGGSQVSVAVLADQDGRAFKFGGDAIGAISAGDTTQYLTLFYNGSNFLLSGVAHAK